MHKRRGMDGYEAAAVFAVGEPDLRQRIDTPVPRPICQLAAVRTRFAIRPHFSRVPCSAPWPGGCSAPPTIATSRACERRRRRQRAGARSSRRLSDDELRARTPMLRERLAAGRDARRPPGRGLRHRARGGQAHPRPAPFRRAADGRHRAAPRHDRRDEDRRGQDAGRDPAGLSQRADRQGRPRRHRQRLPGPPRRRMDGRRSTGSSA